MYAENSHLYGERPSTWLTSNALFFGWWPKYALNRRNINREYVFFYKNNKNTEKNIDHKCKENDWQAIMSISSAPDNSINSPTT